MDSATLVTLLRDLDLWPEDHAAQRQILELSRRFPDGRSLARELIQLDLLTPYQANQILTGKGQSLVVGPYRLVERLGEGGMGLVFKARHCLMNRLVALKILRPEKVTNTTLGRFRREIESGTRLSHPSIVPAYDAAEIDDTYYYAMQYLEGADLARLVKENGPLPVSQACAYAAQAADGLQHIHESGLVHRDVKPSNLMITTTPEPRAADGSPGAPGMVKILDLGIARLCEESADRPRRTVLTQLGVIMGTADYMAPEQARDSREADARSDIYALGCTLYFALTGRAPFPGGNALEKMLAHQLDEPIPLESLRPDVSPALAGVVRRMMAKQPAERYQTAKEVAEALAPFAALAPVAVATAPARTYAASVAIVPERGAAFNRWVWIGAASAITCVVVMLLLLIRLVSG